MHRGWPLLVLLLGACHSPPPAVEIGSGVARFEALIDGQDVPMIEGAQGGWHLWIGVRARGIDPTAVQMAIATFPRVGERPRQTSFHTLDLAPRDGWYERAGLVQVLSTPECFQDRAVVVSVDATDRAGRRVRDERVVVPRWPAPIGACAP